MRRTLTFRCARCHAATRARAEWTSPNVPAIVRCARCGNRYRLTAERPRGRNDAAYLRHVAACARQGGLDIPTATSVVEGILGLAEARELCARVPIGAAPVKRERHGRLAATVAILVLTGVGGYAATVWSHGSPTASTADGLKDRNATRPAVRTAARRPARAAEVPRPAQAPRRTVPTEPRDVALQHATIRQDRLGRPTRISAPDPHAVLVAFCSTGPGAGWRDPLRVVADPPSDPAARYGLYRDHQDLATPMAIPIFKDPRSGRWFAGDGEAPITGLTADVPPRLAAALPEATPGHRAGS